MKDNRLIRRIVPGVSVVLAGLCLFVWLESGTGEDAADVRDAVSAAEREWAILREDIAWGIGQVRDSTDDPGERLAAVDAFLTINARAIESERELFVAIAMARASGEAVPVEEPVSGVLSDGERELRALQASVSGAIRAVRESSDDPVERLALVDQAMEQTAEDQQRIFELWVELAALRAGEPVDEGSQEEVEGTGSEPDLSDPVTMELAELSALLREGLSEARSAAAGPEARLRAVDEFLASNSALFERERELLEASRLGPAGQ